MKPTQWKAAVLAGLLFLGGAAAGALAHRYYSVTTVAAKITETARQRYINEMMSRLHLTPSQLNQLELIMDDTKAKMRAVRDSYKPQMVELKQQHMAKVKAMLTPSQVSEYEKLVAEREKRAHDEEERDRTSSSTH